MRQCENIFVFIDLTKSIGSDLGGQCPPRPPPNSAYAFRGADTENPNIALTKMLSENAILYSVYIMLQKYVIFHKGFSLYLYLISASVVTSEGILTSHSESS